MRYQPIRYRQIREILDWIQAFHERLSIEYETMSQGQVRERVALLLQYLAEHQRRLQNAIKNFGDTASSEVLNTWHDHFPELDLPETLDELKHHLAVIDTEDVIQLAVKFHDVLICLFEEIRNTASTDEVRDVFDSLVQMERREQERMVRDSAFLEDV